MDSLKKYYYFLIFFKNAELIFALLHLRDIRKYYSPDGSVS